MLVNGERRGDGYGFSKCFSNSLKYYSLQIITCSSLGYLCYMKTNNMLLLLFHLLLLIDSAGQLPRCP